MPIAHYLTLIRILISPIFLFVYVYYEALGLSFISLSLFLAFLIACAELSDALDGLLARKYNQVTELGKILDPMADSIYRISLFLTFTLPPIKIPMGLIFVIFYRDSLVSTLRIICALKGFALSARASGKIKAVVQAIAAFSILILMLLAGLSWISQEELSNFSTYIAALATVYTFYTGIDYIAANKPYIKKAFYPKVM